MKKVIAAMNMSLDGFCDHTEMTADEQVHEHYNELLSNGGALIYGRITYQLMESYWPDLIKNPSGNKPMDDFAVIIQNIPKIVFSHTLKSIEWENARLAKGSIKEEISALKQQEGKDILIGSPGLIAAAMDLGLVDEFQINVQPIILGKGLLLLKNITHRIDLKLLNTKTFDNGSIIFYYEPIKS